ncbi:hypothetical protein EVAR_9452_1 [Eumeta japonica]|uniref:Uncharacterized protein n=1 Tax=Eumeta variegata TaxID=151549 RepID=A0A4C1UEJ8_EUMVA|nr:hypothetical protein EVAR_9452_1 [Eumeta japonica]
MEDGRQCQQDGHSIDRQPTHHARSIAPVRCWRSVPSIAHTPAPTPRYTTWHHNTSDRRKDIGSHETYYPNLLTKRRCELTDTRRLTIVGRRDVGQH